MLNVYAAHWCPHCQMTIEHLKKIGVKFNYIDIEKQPDKVVQKIVDVNGGEDWKVPTFEYNGKWREGKVFDAAGLENDLMSLGVTK